MSTKKEVVLDGGSNNRNHEWSHSSLCRRGGGEKNRKSEKVRIVFLNLEKRAGKRGNSQRGSQTETV